MPHVAIEQLPALDYARDCVALSADYGQPAWEARPEVQAIRAAVFAALDQAALDPATLAKLRGRQVIVKPNLVLVYKDIGTRRASYPETTDPRVLDAVVLWLQTVAQAGEVIIAESSGRGSPTRAGFALSGVDRLARRRGCRLVALEEEPADRYFLPQATVQREILVPRLFSAVVCGEAAYVSVPKLKTNLYTGVTLGFKNAMGVIPYNLRQRAHHHAIDRKLVEMLYLFQPDLVLIDGVVGGEGECPAPVDPVDARLIIAGDQAVETDRVATRCMGFDPADFPLMRIADELGFASTEPVTIHGRVEPVAFRPADASLLSARVHALFPELTVLYGLTRGLDAADQASLAQVSADYAAAASPTAPAAATANPDAAEARRQLVQRMEAGCRGGCVASTRFGLTMLEAEGHQFRKPVLLAIGPGLATAGGPLWLDGDGRVWDRAAINRFRGRKAAIGHCSATLAPDCNWFVDGCMPLANAPHAILHRLAGTGCAILSARNRHLGRLLGAVLGQRRARLKLLRSGQRLDVAFPLADQLDDIPPELEAAAARLPPGQTWLAWPLPPLLDPAEKRALCAAEDEMTLASLSGLLQPGLATHLGWRLLAILTALATWSPLGLAVLASRQATGRLAGLAWPWWLAVSAGLGLLHAAELLPALRAHAALAPGGRLKPGQACGLALAILLAGFPVWLPAWRRRQAILTEDRLKKARQTLAKS